MDPPAAPPLRLGGLHSRPRRAGRRVLSSSTSVLQPHEPKPLLLLLSPEPWGSALTPPPASQCFPDPVSTTPQCLESPHVPLPDLGPPASPPAAFPPAPSVTLRHLGSGPHLPVLPSPMPPLARQPACSALSSQCPGGLCKACPPAPDPRERPFSCVLWPPSSLGLFWGWHPRLLRKFWTCGSRLVNVSQANE